MNKSTFEEYIKVNDTLIYSTKGCSMRPMLKQDRDLVILKQKEENQRLKKYDVALYVNHPHKYILHRVVEVNGDSYVFLGDNCIHKEYGIKDSDIIGVMTGFVRKGREFSTFDINYRIYSHLWHYAYPIRWLWKKTKLRLIKLRRKAR